jgi:hypothetical protein
MAGGFVALIAFVQNWLEAKDSTPNVAKENRDGVWSLPTPYGQRSQM